MPRSERARPGVRSREYDCWRQRSCINQLRAETRTHPRETSSRSASSAAHRGFRSRRTLENTPRARRVVRCRSHCSPHHGGDGQSSAARTGVLQHAPKHFSFFKRFHLAAGAGRSATNSSKNAHSAGSRTRARKGNHARGTTRSARAHAGFCGRNQGSRSRASTAGRTRSWVR